MSCGGSGSSASDTASNVITYVGVPLAVLGILPILYSFVATVALLRKVNQALKRSGLGPIATTRSDFSTRIVEVVLPRYRLARLGRGTSEYWKPSRQRSAIPGGTWKELSWDPSPVAPKTQRCQYVDEVKQPQAEVDFEHLIWYLLDLGAAPLAQGWSVLRTSGLWTSKDQCLMKSPDGRSDVLTVGPSDDSDGYLSLKLHWSPTWKTTRDVYSLPPEWVLLPGDPSSTGQQEVKLGAQETVTAAEVPPSPDVSVQGEGGPGIRNSNSEKQADLGTAYDLCCRLSFNERLQVTAGVGCGSVIDHLPDGGEALNGSWYVSALAAYASASDSVLFYTIPEALSNFARKATVPCGVLALLGIVSDSDVPVAWSKDDAPDEASEFLRRREEERLAIGTESLIRSNMRERDRRQREHEERERLRSELQNRDKRMEQALQSTPWDNEVVANSSLRWLRDQPFSDTASLSNLETAVNTILRGMILDPAYAASLFRVLDLWKDWSSNGGIKQADVETLAKAPMLFADATLLVGLMKAAGTSGKGALAADLRKCFEAHKIVRLG